MTPEERREHHRAACKAYRERNAASCNAYAKAYRLAHKTAPQPPPTEKTCAHCLVVKPRGDFYARRRITGQRPTRGALGVEAICKTCKSHQRKPSLAAERKARRELEAARLKKCNVCFEIKPYADFSGNKASKDGRNYTCRECANARLAQHRADNPDGFDKWYQRNKEHRDQYASQYRLERKAELRQNYKAWKRANPGIVAANVAKRVAVKLRATPPWCDLIAVRRFYQDAAALTRSTGIRHEVDHIVPLRSRIVCGLHVPCNLQVLTRADNLKKSNRITSHDVTILLVTPYETPPAQTRAESR